MSSQTAIDKWVALPYTDIALGDGAVRRFFFCPGLSLNATAKRLWRRGAADERAAQPFRVGGRVPFEGRGVNSPPAIA